MYSHTFTCKDCGKCNIKIVQFYFVAVQHDIYCSPAHIHLMLTTHYHKGMEIQASNEDYLRDLKKNHKKKDKGVFGASQCDKHRKGKKV